MTHDLFWLGRKRVGKQAERVEREKTLYSRAILIPTTQCALASWWRFLPAGYDDGRYFSYTAGHSVKLNKVKVNGGPGREKNK